ELGIQQDPEAVLRVFALRYGGKELKQELPTMGTDDIINRFRWFGQDAERFGQLAGMALSTEDSAARLFLLKRFLWLMPGVNMDSQGTMPPGFLSQYLDLIDAALAEVAAGLGRPAPKSVKVTASGDFTLSHRYQEQQALMAEALLKQEDPGLKAEGQEALLGLSSSRAGILSPHEVMSPRLDLFGQNRGGQIHTVMDFTPAFFKLERLVAAAQKESDEHALFYLREAELLMDPSVIDLSPEDQFVVVEKKLFMLMKLAALYGRASRPDQADSLFQRAQFELHRLQTRYGRELEDFLALPASQREGGAFSIGADLPSHIQELEFWTQELESRQSAVLARWMHSYAPARSQARLEALVSSLEKEVELRRDRFDVRSMISAASVLEEAPGLQGYARKIYGLCIAKLALLRGDGGLFTNNAGLLVERVTEGRLSDADKDALLAETVRTLVPPKGKRGWDSMADSLQGLLALSDKALKRKTYPETEKELLQVFAEVTEDTGFDRGDWKNDKKLLGLAGIFDQIASADPEIAAGEGLEVLAGLGAEGRYREALGALHRDAWQARTAGQALTREAIRSGAADLQKAGDAVWAALDQAVSAVDLPGLNSALALLKEVRDRELSLFLSQHQSRQPTLAELGAVPSINGLLRRVRPSLRADSGPLSAISERMVDALLFSSDKETFKAQTPLYADLLEDAGVSLAVKRKAFEGMVAAGGVSRYAESFFRSAVEGKAGVSEERFYGWMARFLEAGRLVLPADPVLAYLLQDPGKEAVFFEKYLRIKGLPRMPWLIGQWGTETQKTLDYFQWRKRGDDAAYHAEHVRLVRENGAWVPDPFDELDLLLSRPGRVHDDGLFEDWIETIRNWFVYDLFRVGWDEGRIGLTALEHKLGKIAPRVKLTDEQRAYLSEYLEKNGEIEYAALTRYLGVEFTHEETAELMRSLFPGARTPVKNVVELFGRPRFDPAAKAELDRVLDAVRANAKVRGGKIAQESVELPEVFEKSQPIVKEALTEYFSLLSFGEREAILNDFNTEGLSEEGALKRFFEVTGNEKLGQFLSLRRDLIPERYRRELERFQENVEPSSFEEIKSTIEKELEAPLGTHFASIGPKPLKVGTIGEVYEVTLKDGTRAVVKVITPSKRKAIELNLARLKVVARTLSAEKDRFEQKTDFARLFAELERSIKEELDLTLEYANAMRFAGRLPAGVSIPKFYGELTRPSVLVQSFADGVNPTSLPEPLRKQTADRLSDLFLEQVLSQDSYHDDLHPGNIRVDGAGNITLLDFGRIGRLTPEDRAGIIPLLLAVRSQDPGAILQVLEKIGTRGDDYDPAGLRTAVTRLLAERQSASSLVSALFFEAGNHGLEIRSVYLQLIKGILTFEGTAHQLDPEFDLEARIRPFIMKGWLGTLLSL
ncbi:MAG: AarF/UbiB family protein, partial [Elusimicrobiota bacterium]